MAVEVDPDFDVEAANLANCEPVLLGRLSGWLKPEQMRLTARWLCTTAWGRLPTCRLAWAALPKGRKQGRLAICPTAPVPPIPARYD